MGRGDNHPVLVLPGFAADDRSTRPLRSVLRAQGYWVHGWGLGRNLPNVELFYAMRARLVDLHARHGAPVSLVGQSLGGVYARELAREHPEMVRQVITLASPFRLRPGDASSVSTLAQRVLRPMDPLPWGVTPEEDRPAVPVPVTAIYSRTDGIVRWWTTIEAAGPSRENIEVRGSHSGLAVLPAVVYAVADRLAQPAGQWAPFRPPWPLRQLYPEPVSWRPRPAAAR
jgi:pimeloyl-ACP methyl ester carboxylesterase